MNEISYGGRSSPFRQRLSKRVILFGTFFVIILILLSGVAYFATRGSTPSEEQEPTPAPTIEVTEAPTPTPTEEPTPTPKSKSTPIPTKASSSQTGIVVQNGSGVAGAAASAAAVLKEAGYSVSTGNAQNFDYTGVTIKVKAGKSDLLTALKNILSKDYSISATSSDLSEGQAYDALVIVGR